jgi:hypothetical protein
MRDFSGFSPSLGLRNGVKTVVFHSIQIPQKLGIGHCFAHGASPLHCAAKELDPSSNVDNATLPLARLFLPIRRRERGEVEAAIAPQCPQWVESGR